ncbi:MAG: DUF5330 domain-containing protein [bacterium]|nr:DUF5330 domain-containing protein [bacterium]
MLKKLLFIGAIIAVIPLDRENQTDLYEAAKSTVSDIMGFCDRNSGVCEKGNAAIDKLATKAEFGARMMVDIAKEQSGTSLDDVAQLLKATNLSRGLNRPQPMPAQSAYRFPTYQDKQYNDHYGSTSNTLNPSDLKPGWRGNK